VADQRIFYSAQPVFPLTPSNPSVKSPAFVVSEKSSAFGQILNEQITGLKFSQHAISRLQSRNITLSTTDLHKINAAVKKAEQKGAKESLMLLDNIALVVSVKNKTVITAMDGASMKNNVFTNIDSAIIL
jgi:flagellar operon protein